MTEFVIESKRLTKVYGNQTVVNAVDLHVKKGRNGVVLQDVSVISSQLCNDTLEDYFKKITGGEGIA